MRNNLHRVLLSSIEWNNSYNIKGLGLLCHLVSCMDKYTFTSQAGPKPQMTNTTTWAKREISVSHWLQNVAALMWNELSFDTDLMIVEMYTVKGKLTGITVL